MNFSSTQSEIEALFSQVGDVVEVFVPTDRASGRPRGFAFVEYTEESAAAKAIEELDGKELGGRQIRVTEAQDRPPRRPPSFSGGDFPPFAPGGGGGGGGGDRRAKPKGSRRNIRGKKRSL